MAGPLPQVLDLGAHEHGERIGLPGDTGEVVGERLGLGEIRIPVEEGFADHLLQFGAGEAAGLFGEFVQLGLGGLIQLTALLEVNLEDLAADGLRWQVDEEDLVEPAFAQQFRREHVDAVRGRDDEDLLLLLLHPGQQGAYDAGGRAAVAAIAAAHAGEAFLDLIDPEHARLEGGRDLQGGADVPFGLADDAAEHLAEVETQKRVAPFLGDGLGDEALAAALDAEEHDALGGFDALLLRLIGEGALALLEPHLEVLEAADVLAEVRLGLEELQDLGLLDDAGFLVGDLAEDFGLMEAGVLDVHLGEGELGFHHGQAGGGVDDRFGIVRQLMPRLCEHGLEDGLQHATAGQGKFEGRDVLAYFRRERRERRRDHDQAFATAAIAGEVLQLRQQSVVILGQVTVQVFHHPDGIDVRVFARDRRQDVAGADERVIEDVLEVVTTRLDRVNALGRAPADDRLVLVQAFGAQFQEAGAEALPLMGDQVDDAHPGFTEEPQFVLEFLVDGHVRGRRRGHGFGLACS